DWSNNRIRRVDSVTGLISTMAGGGSVSGDGGLATSTYLVPFGITVDASRNIFFTDAGSYNTYTVRRIDATTGIITTVAGGGNVGYRGDGGAATSASLYNPLDLAGMRKSLRLHP